MENAPGQNSGFLNSVGLLQKDHHHVSHHSRTHVHGRGFPGQESGVYQRHSGGDASSALISDRQEYQVPTGQYLQKASLASGVGVTSGSTMQQRKHQYQKEYAYNGRESSCIDSASNQSASTVVRKKSAKSMRTDIKSHVNLLNELDNTLKKKHSNGNRAEGSNKQSAIQKRFPTQHDVVTEIAIGDLDFHTNDSSLEISVDDIVSSKVVNPMIRRFQRMYLNNLKDEISLMEQLEEMPKQISNIYKASGEQNRRDKDERY